MIVQWEGLEGGPTKLEIIHFSKISNGFGSELTSEVRTDGQGKL